MGVVSDVLSCRSPSTRRHNADGNLIGDFVLPACAVYLGTGDLITLPTIQSLVRQWVSKYHWSEVTVS